MNSASTDKKTGSPRTAYRLAPLGAAGVALLFSSGPLAPAALTARDQTRPPRPAGPKQLPVAIRPPSEARLRANSKPAPVTPVGGIENEPVMTGLPAARLQLASAAGAGGLVPVANPDRLAQADLALQPGVPGTPSLPAQDLVLPPGQTRVLEFRGIRRAVIGNPEVADIVPVTTTELVVTGKAAGTTTLLVWDAAGRHVYRLSVAGPAAPAPPDLGEVARQIREALNDQTIQVRAIGDTIFLEGTVNNQAAAQRADLIAQALAPRVKNLIQVQLPAAPMMPVPPPPPPASEAAVRVLSEALGRSGVTVRAVSPTAVLVEGNLQAGDAERVRRIVSSLGQGITVVDALQVEAPVQQQVLIRARVIDINRTRLRDLGVDFGQVVQGRGGGGGSVTDQPFLFGIFGRASSLRINPLDPLGARLRALEQDNAARILSEPNILVLEGAKGSILVGGEFPIPVVQGGGAGTAATVTVEFKEFGVRLGVEPTLVSDNGEITMRVQPEVSLLDYTNGVRLNGFDLPALRTRREDSTIRIAAGQTIAIGGLIENSYSRTARGIPLLSKIPVLGELFKSRSFTRNESELVILITPEVVQPGQNPAGTPLAIEGANAPIKRPEVPQSLTPGAEDRDNRDRRRRDRR